MTSYSHNSPKSCHFLAGGKRTPNENKLFSSIHEKTSIVLSFLPHKYDTNNLNKFHVAFFSGTIFCGMCGASFTK